MNPDRHRLLLYYKSDISALMLFAQQSNGSVCFPEEVIHESGFLEDEALMSGTVSVHPVTLLHRLNQSLRLDHDLLRIESGFCESIDSPGGVIRVHLARFMQLDPPHALMQSRDCRMRTLSELRGRPPAEMELLRRAYVRVMEG